MIIDTSMVRFQNPYVWLFNHHIYLQTIVKKASAMLDGHSTIHRSHRLYYAYLSKTSSSWGPGTSAGNNFCWMWWYFVQFYAIRLLLYDCIDLQFVELLFFNLVDVYKICVYIHAPTGSVNANSGAHAGGNNPSNGNNNSNGNNAHNGTAVEIEHSFGRPMVLAKLGQYIMDIKVRFLCCKFVLYVFYCLLCFVCILDQMVKWCILKICYFRGFAASTDVRTLVLRAN